jgi:hypothetical protein
VYTEPREHLVWHHALPIVMLQSADEDDGQECALSESFRTMMSSP